MKISPKYEALLTTKLDIYHQIGKAQQLTSKTNKFSSSTGPIDQSLVSLMEKEGAREGREKERKYK